MPKVKTRKAVAKRFSFTGSGKLMRMHSYSNAHRLNKARRTRRSYDRPVRVAKSDVKRIEKLLPYGLD